MSNCVFSFVGLAGFWILGLGSLENSEICDLFLCSGFFSFEFVGWTGMANFVFSFVGFSGFWI